MSLPIRKVTLYKHGLGFFERQGMVEGEQLRLEFPRSAMDDILKSLVAISRSGQVLGLEFETPEDRNPAAHRQVLNLEASHSLTQLLGALRGQKVRVETAGQTLEGQLVGAELEDSDHLKRARVSLYVPEQKQVVVLTLASLEKLTLLEETGQGDLEFFLKTVASDEERAAALLRLSQGQHDLLVSYIAPAPAWRVSYRLLVEPKEDKASILLQGWGLFDNTLGEDLDKVELSLVAGMPVSFRYALHQPNTPERPLVQDEERTVSAPVAFDAIPPPQAAAAPMMFAEAVAGGAPREMAKKARARITSEELEQSVQSSATGQERGALFAYQIEHPVSVGRGQSAMVPILSQRLEGQRELLFNERKLPSHPVASVRFKNQTGLALERGPITVLEEASYGGEAVLDFSPSGAEVIVAFAVELGIKVSLQTQSQSQLARLELRPGYLLIQEYQIRTTTYQLQNSQDKPAVVTVEHNRYAGYEFFDMPKPEEDTQAQARWKVPLTPQSKTDFVVQERYLTSRSEEVRNLDYQRLQSFLENKFLDKATFEKLGAILKLYQQVADLEEKAGELEEEREKIAERQTQIQGNLTPLGQGGEEGKLRARLVGEMGKLEDRLQALEQKEAEILKEGERLEAEIKRGLEGLTLPIA